MQTITILIGLVLSASSAFAQSPLYTNADLTPTPVTRWTTTVTAEEFAGLAARQFRSRPQYDGPTVIVIGSSYDAFDVPYVRPGSAPRITGSDPVYALPYYDVLPSYGFGSYGLRSDVGSRHGHRTHDRSRVTPTPVPVAPLQGFSSGAATGGAVRTR